MRVEYLHSGGPAGETIKLDRFVQDGPWAGSLTRLIDRTNLGAYFFEVIDQRTRRVVFSRGFSSIYGEWITTPESRTATRTFRESLRFPWPASPVRIILKTRDEANAFRNFWSGDIDPSSVDGLANTPPPAGTVWTVFENGSSSRKVDFLLVSEGYRADELPRFHADVSRLVETLFALEPFKTRKSDFNVRALDLPGRTLGVERNIFGLARYMLTSDDRAFRDAVAAVPHDVVEIVANDDQYGGGGIFNLQSTVAAGAAASGYVFVHELAHNLAGLGDEYVGNVTYETGKTITAEPWEPNLTALLDPARLKWRDLVARGTPLPTPITMAGRVGAFEGAGYEAKGLYRPEADCIMFSRNPVPFCRVCQRAINTIIDTYTR
jgi:hypothetical protein